MSGSGIITFYKLRVFVSVARQGSFSRAAEALFLTQSAVSQHVLSLERGLGTRLFKRTSRGVRLTTSGNTLLTYAEQILWLVAAAEKDVVNVEGLQSGKLWVGATPVASVYLLPSWLKQFATLYPQLTVSVHTGTTSQVIAQVRSRPHSLGIVEGEVQERDGLEILVLRPTRLWLVVSPLHPWAGKTHISIHALNDCPFLARALDSQTRLWMENILRRYEVQPRIVAEFDDPDSIRKAVINNLGVSILPECMVRDDLEQGTLHGLQIAELPLERALKAVWDARFPLGPIAGSFLDMLRTQGVIAPASALET